MNNYGYLTDNHGGNNYREKKNIVTLLSISLHPYHKYIIGCNEINYFSQFFKSC